MLIAFKLNEVSYTSFAAFAKEKGNSSTNRHLKFRNQTIELIDQHLSEIISHINNIKKYEKKKKNIVRYI